MAAEFFCCKLLCRMMSNGLVEKYGLAKTL